MTIHVDLLGRLGTFGLSVMKTKADRMWEEFAQNLVARLVPATVGEPSTSATQQAAPSAPAAEQGSPSVSPTTRAKAPAPVAQTQATSWWVRVLAPLAR